MDTQQETEEGQLRRAYQIGLKLKNSGLEPDVIYARIEKQGISPEIAHKVAQDILIQQTKDSIQNERPFYHLALIKIGLGVLAAIIVMIFVPGSIFLPIGLIGSGIIFAVAFKEKRK